MTPSLGSSDAVAISIVGFFSTYMSIMYIRKCRKPTIVCGSGESAELMKQCPTLNSIYFPFFFAWGKYSQLVLFTGYGYLQKYLRTVEWKTVRCALEDGEVMDLDWAQGASENGWEESNSITPILILLHGAMCYNRHLPGQGWVFEAHRRGWMVCCMNRRGAKAPLTEPRMNLFGSTDDIRWVLNKFIMTKRPNARILMVGISAGSGLLGRYLGDEGELSTITAAMGLAPGYDISVCMGRCTSLVKGYLTGSVIDSFFNKNAQLLEKIQGSTECISAKDPQIFLDNSYAIAGYASKDEYYKACNPVNVLANVRTPFMLINAEDDPISVYQNVTENEHLFRTSPSMILVSTKTGTHCAFWEGFSIHSWAERATYEFFDEVLRRDADKFCR